MMGGFGEMKTYYRAGDRYVDFSTISEVTESATDDCGVDYRLRDVFSPAQEFTGTIKVTEEVKALMLGFKSVAEMHRYYRRIKRRKEKERRERLKRANELH